MLFLPSHRGSNSVYTPDSYGGASKSTRGRWSGFISERVSHRTISLQGSKESKEVYGGEEI